MLDWLKNLNKEYPEFWKDYLAKLDKKSNRFVAFSMETTGLSPSKDVILSIGAIAVEHDRVVVGDTFEVVIPQYKFLHDNGITNEFFSESRLPKLAEPQALEEFIKFIGNATLVGHRIHFDLDMLHEALEKIQCGRIRNQAFDIEVLYKKLHDINDKNFSLEELSNQFKIPKTEHISALNDAYNIALLFIKLKSRLGI